MAKSEMKKVLESMSEEDLKQTAKGAGIELKEDTVDEDAQADEDLKAAMDALESGEDTVEYVSASVSASVSEPVVSSDEELHERETSIGTKSIQSGGYNTREGVLEEESKEIGGKITRVDGDTFHYEGTLGTFDYDSKEWGIHTKTITSKDGMFKTEIPVLRYIGKATAGNDVEIPDGVKCLDYTFEGNTKLETVPYIPDSVESAHAAFMGCKSITRASKDAKEGEHQGGFDLAGWGLGGAGAGATVGGIAGCGIGSVPGAVVGGIVGGVGGIAKGTYDYFTKDGKGGTWTMPANLKDASYMFDGCVNLTEAYEAASDELILARGMYRGDKNIGTDSYATSHGSVSVTDLSDSKVSKEGSEDSYDGANDDVIRAAANNYSKDWDEDAGTLNRSDLTYEEKREVEDLNLTLKAEDVKNGVVETDMSVATGGVAHSAKIRTEHGYKSTTNINDESVEESNGLLDGLGGVAGLVDRGVVSFAEFKLLKMVTGSTLLSAGITFGGQMLGILPTSIKPILTTVADFVGTDNPVGKALNGLADKLPDTDTKKSTHEKLPESASGLVSSASDRMESSVKDPLILSAKGKLNGQEIESSMDANARKMVQDGVFYDVGLAMGNSSETQSMNRIAMLTGAALEEHGITMAGDSEYLSDEQKKMLSENVMNVMSGMEAYSSAAYDEVSIKYANDPDKLLSTEQGVCRVMSSTLEPLYQSVQELDDKYQFLSKDDKDFLDNLSFDAGIPTYTEYCDGSKFEANVSRDRLDAKQALVAEGYSEEEMMYANAGLDDLDSDHQDAKESGSKDSGKSDKQDDGTRTKESADAVKNNKKMTREQRLALAGITDDEPSTQSESDGVIREYE